jgi:hypothetical protein
VAGVRAVYDVLGVRVGVESSDGGAVTLIDRSYGGFRTDDIAADQWLTLTGDGPNTSMVRAPDGSTTIVEAGGPAALALLHRLVIEIMAGLRASGRYAVHAAAVARGNRALILAGPGGTGKTTLALALAARGFELLSDELAVIDPAGPLIHPYRRNVHVRPGTPELVDGLAGLLDRPREVLGGGIAWAIPHEDLGHSRSDAPRELAGVVLLHPRDPAVTTARLTPARSSIAAMELLRGTWAASVDFTETLAAVAAGVERVPCMRLTPADPMPTADLLRRWFESGDD